MPSELVYDRVMNGHDRAARMARVAYIGALRRLAAAMIDFERARVPLEPGPDGQIAPWSEQEHDVMAACAQAWSEVVERRRAFDVAVHEAGHREIWRHA
jgi:hypothetical protein